jgi:hypothetical protein
MSAVFFIPKNRKKQNMILKDEKSKKCRRQSESWHQKSTASQSKRTEQKDKKRRKEPEKNKLHHKFIMGGEEKSISLTVTVSMRKNWQAD